MRIGVCFAAIAALAACSPEPSPQPSDDRAAETAAPATQPDPAPAAAIRSETPPLTAEGWGPLRIGMTLAEVTEAAGPDSKPALDGGPEPESCDIFHPERAPAGMQVMIVDGRLGRITLADGAGVQTDRGFGLGASAAKVKSAYGDAAKVTPHEYEAPAAEYVTVWAAGAGAEPYVRSASARGIRYEIDQSGKVDMIHAGGPSIQYVEGCL